MVGNSTFTTVPVIHYGSILFISNISESYLKFVTFKVFKKYILTSRLMFLTPLTSRLMVLTPLTSRLMVLTPCLKKLTKNVRAKILTNLTIKVNPSVHSTKPKKKILFRHKFVFLSPFIEKVILPLLTVHDLDHLTFLSCT